MGAASRERDELMLVGADMLAVVVVRHLRLWILLCASAAHAEQQHNERDEHERPHDVSSLPCSALRTGRTQPSEAPAQRTDSSVAHLRTRVCTCRTGARGASWRAGTRVSTSHEAHDAARGRPVPRATRERRK